MQTSKKILPVLGGLLLFFLLNAFLNFALIPYQFTRMKIHTIENETFDDLILGSSHASAAIDPERFTEELGRSCFNAAAGGQYPRENYYLLLDACEKHVPGRILLEYDPSYWVSGDSFNAAARYQLSEMEWSRAKWSYARDLCPGSDIRFVLMPWSLYVDLFPDPAGSSGNLLQRMADNIRTRLGEDYRQYGTVSFLTGSGQACDQNGFTYIPDFVPGDRTIPEFSFGEDKEAYFETNRQYFEKTLDLCRKNGIEVVVFTTPVPKTTLEQNRDFYREAHRRMADLSREHSFRYLDFCLTEAEPSSGPIAGGQDLPPGMEDLSSDSLFSDAKDLSSDSLFSDAKDLSSDSLFSDAEDLSSDSLFSDAEGHMYICAARQFTTVLAYILRP